MPISSGAGGWPNSHWNNQPPQPAEKNVPHGVNSQHGYHGNGRDHDKFNRGRSLSPDRHHDDYDRGRHHGYERGQRGYPRDEYPRDTNSGCCGGDTLYSTGVAGAGAGCCQGGMFGSMKYPFNDQPPYAMAGSGRRRCCACACATIFALLLLGLILGLVLGLAPYIAAQDAQTALAAKYPGGFFLDGVYYLPVADEPNTFFLLLGPGIPCNPFNNNSDIPSPTSSLDYVTDSVTGGYTVLVTDVDLVTLPNCDSITTSIVPVTGNFDPPTVKYVPWVTPSSAARDVINMAAVMCGLGVVCLLSQI